MRNPHRSKRCEELFSTTELAWCWQLLAMEMEMEPLLLVRVVHAGASPSHTLPMFVLMQHDGQSSRKACRLNSEVR
jgi:hypothetical protein